MKRNSNPPNDDYQIRCRKLGHQIYFSYCAKENQGLPCYRTPDCWHEHFEVENFLKETLSPAQRKAAFDNPPKPKLASLLELIEQAKKRQGQKT